MEKQDSEFSKEELAAILKENILLKQQIEELKKDQLYFNALLNEIPAAIYFKDRNSRFLKASNFMAKAFKVENTNAIVGKTDFELQPLEHAEKAFADEQSVIKTGIPLIDKAEKILRPDNQYHWMLTTKLPLKDDKGNIIGLVGIGKDITRIKELELSIVSKNEELISAEEELRQIIDELEIVHEEIIQQKEEIELQKEKIVAQNLILEDHKNILEHLVQKRTEELRMAVLKAEESDRLKSAFLANVSHEIRTPMNAIVGFSQLLNSPEISQDDLAKYIDLINNSAKSLMTLINDILDLSMIQSDQMVIQEHDFGINQMLNDLFAIFSISNDNSVIDFKLNNPIKNKNLILRSDIQRINQLLSNLVTNAFKFTSKGSIELGVILYKSRIVFYVSDTGIGIPKQSLKYIFDRFRKIEKGFKTVFRGAGLGLAISKNLADRLGGELTVTSTLGKGSTFSFSLPKAKIVSN